MLCVKDFCERRHSAVATFSISLIQCSHAAMSVCEAGIASGFLKVRSDFITSILSIEEALIIAIPA